MLKIQLKINQKSFIESSLTLRSLNINELNWLMKKLDKNLSSLLSLKFYQKIRQLQKRNKVVNFYVFYVKSYIIEKSSCFSLSSFPPELIKPSSTKLLLIAKTNSPRYFLVPETYSISAGFLLLCVISPTYLMSRE